MSDAERIQQDIDWLLANPKSPVDALTFNYHMRSCDSWRFMEALLARLRESEAVRKRLVGTLEHIEEYWNQNQNDTAMFDALWHIIEEARAAIAASPKQSTAPPPCGSKGKGYDAGD